MTELPADAKRLRVPPGGVTVRMYRQGLGDAFLLAFGSPEPNETRYMLIDCGVHGAQKGGGITLEAAVDDIAQATGGCLDVVVATHEHTDHLSGFVREASHFVGEGIEIDELWLAWTENLRDPLARRLHKGRAAAKEAVRKALARLKEKVREGRTRLATASVSGFSGFFEMASPEGVDFTAMGKRLGVRDPEKVTGNELALAVLKERANRKRYFRPGGEPQQIPGVHNARAYILGPPRDEQLLKRSDPSRGSRSEVYFTADSSLLSFVAAVHGGAQDDEMLKELADPFDERHRRGRDWASKQKFFKDTYDHGHFTWRQIEDDWLLTAETLALHLDSDTNNTSLALALEVGAPGSGRVLLFPGDAQVGNWLSWRQPTWRVGQQEVNAEDLLQRTILYKVSHHASHNGTVKRDAEGQPFGLELMPQGMMAMIPVDHAAASKLRGWDMPYEPLYEVLKEKTNNRILRSDDLDRGIRRPGLRESAVPEMADVRWRRSRETKADGNSLYYDVSFAAD